MKARTLLGCVVALVWTAGCANHIKQANTIIWDRVEGTERVSLDDMRIEGAIVRAKVRFTCQKRQYAVTNDYVTPWRAKDELYEVPVGLVTTPFTLAWWVVTKLVSLGAAENTGAKGPLDWSVAGLNPFLPVENGMFVERYVIREKKGSRRPQEGSSPEPYDAVLPPEGGKVKAWFEGGKPVELNVGEELLLTINLVELAYTMPAPDAQKITIELKLKWNAERPALTKRIHFFISKPLAQKLYALKDASRTLMTTSDPVAFRQALKKVEDAGFSRAAAMIRDRRQSQLKQAG